MNNDNKKSFWQSNTIQFFFLVMAGGGADLVVTFLQTNDISYRSFIIMIISLFGIGLRLKTTQELK